MKIHITRHARSRLTALLLCATSGFAAAQAADPATAAPVRTAIAKAYDQPGQPVDTAPVVIVGDYAIADWTQGAKGGRALLRRSQGQWQVLACGGDDFKKVSILKDAGIPAATAKTLTAQLAKAEQSVRPERVRQFGLFGTADDPRHQDHQGHQGHHAPQKN